MQRSWALGNAASLNSRFCTEFDAT